MARNPIIQVTCPPSLYQRLETYKNKTPHASMSDVGRELLEFALLIKERTDDSEARTNRELMEEILLKLCVNEEMLKNNYAHVFQDGKSWNSTLVEMMKEDVSRANLKGRSSFEFFMNKEDAEK